MIYEFIATITAGFGMAGLALIIRHVSKLAGKPAPKWITPLFIAIGMLGFQIHQEYYWYEQTTAKLPDDVKVIKTVESSAWYKPWSYIKPQTAKFMAIDTSRILTYYHNPNLKMVDLYLFERRMSTKRETQIINCATAQRADYISSTDTTEDKTHHTDVTIVAPNLTWYSLADDDPILQIACG